MTQGCEGPGAHVRGQRASSGWGWPPARLAGPEEAVGVLYVASLSLWVEAARAARLRHAVMPAAPRAAVPPLHLAQATLLVNRNLLSKQKHSNDMQLLPWSCAGMNLQRRGSAVATGVAARPAAVLHMPLVAAGQHLQDTCCASNR